MTLYLGIDLGGTQLKLTVTDVEGGVRLQRQTAMPSDRSVSGTLDLICNMIEVCRNECSGTIASVGLTMPCVLDMENDAVLLIPNFPREWIGIQLGLLLTEKCGIPVHMLNDARAATYAELRLGAGRGYKEFIAMFLGTGVGGGIVLNGELWTGARGVAGEIGHMTVVPDGLRCGCGNRGCLETVASGPSITSEAVRRIIQGLPTRIRDMVHGDILRITPEVVDQAAAEGDEAALEILKQAAAAIRQSLLSIRALLNPQALILGGGVGQSDILFNLIKTGFEYEEILFPGSLGRVEIKRAEFSQWAGAIGAAIWARDQGVKETIRS